MNESHIACPISSSHVPSKICPWPETGVHVACVQETQVLSVEKNLPGKFQSANPSLIIHNAELNSLDHSTLNYHLGFRSRRSALLPWSIRSAPGHMPSAHFKPPKP